jgi:DNA-directed RNA polymerase subunit K/omega
LFSNNPDRATHPEVLQSINYEELPIAEDKHKPIEQAIEDINNDNYEVHDDLDDIDRT